MNTTSTNVFKIEGIEQYSAKYRLYLVRGLAPENEDYHRNINALAQRVARDLRAPVMPLSKEKPFLVIRDGAEEPKRSHQLVRATAVLERQDKIFTLDFKHLTDETRPIGLRFLQFALQGLFWRHQHLWQPQTGGTFFERVPARIGRSIGLHRGFLARIIDLESDGFGVCIDVRHKYVSTRPLPAFISRRTFAERFRGAQVIYHYGHEWFQVRWEEINDLTVTEFMITKDAKQRSLLEYVQVHSEKPLPPELAHLPKDCSVVHYFNSRDEKMAAPSGLCYAAYSTSHADVRREHGRTLLPPQDRRGVLEEFRERYLGELKLNGRAYRLAQRALTTSTKVFPVPDLLFHGDVVLSAKGTNGAIAATLDSYGRKRLELLKDKRAGFFSDSPFQKQFFFMPESIWQSWGPQLIQDLVSEVDAFYPQEHSYDPQVIRYNDSRGPTWVDQGMAIFEAAKDRNCRGGFAVAMLHDTRPRYERKEEELAAFVLRKLYKDFDIRAAVMHTDTGRRAYQITRDATGGRIYAARREMRGRLDGYIRNVALNKVLLTNEKWPFVLAQPTHADVTIGVDLKSHHVGFTLVGRGGQYIATRIRETRFHELIRPEEFKIHFYEIVRQYHDATGEFASGIVVQRDGRMFEPEVAGAHSGLDKLLADGFVSPTATLTCVEIGKHSFTSLRLFSVDWNGKSEITSNPVVGQYFIPTLNDGYLVATGRPFARQGTVLPLHIHKLEGPIPMVDLLEDTFQFTNLAWSQPEGCTRNPITIKINDRRLLEDAAEYDKNEIELQEEEADV